METLNLVLPSVHTVDELHKRSTQNSMIKIRSKLWENATIPYYFHHTLCQYNILKLNVTIVSSNTHKTHKHKPVICVYVQRETTVAVLQKNTGRNTLTLVLYVWCKP